MKTLLFCGATLAAFALPTLAQPRAATGNSGIFSLPPSVNNVVALDAYNSLFVETEDEVNGIRVTEMPVRRIYAGGVARLFGGIVVPTLPYISPGTFAGGGFGITNASGGGNNGNFGAGQGIGNGGGVGGNTGFGGGNTGGFNNALGNTNAFGGTTTSVLAQLRARRGGAR
jgi:hypothetical protein